MSGDQLDVTPVGSVTVGQRLLAGTGQVLQVTAVQHTRAESKVTYGGITAHLGAACQVRRIMGEVDGDGEAR